MTDYLRSGELSPYEEGREAYAEGLDPCENPYRPYLADDDEYDWDRGWDDADRERRECQLAGSKAPNDEVNTPKPSHEPPELSDEVNTPMPYEESTESSDEVNVPQMPQQGTEPAQKEREQNLARLRESRQARAERASLKNAQRVISHIMKVTE